MLASIRLNPRFRRFFTPSIMAKINENYPEFRRLFEVIDTLGISEDAQLTREVLGEHRWGGFLFYLLVLH